MPDFTFEEATAADKTFTFEEAKTSFSFEEAQKPSKTLTFPLDPDVGAAEEAARPVTEGLPSADVTLAADRERFLSGLVDTMAKGETRQPVTPLVQLPKAEVISGPFPGQKPPVAAQVAAGAYNALAAVPEFLTVPQGATTLMAGTIPGIMQRLISAGFAVDLALHTPQQIQNLNAAVESKEPARIAEAATSMGLHAAFLAMTARGALRESPVEQVAAVAPRTAEALKQQTETLKPTATERTADALQERQATEVLRDVPTPPEAIKPEVPTAESAKGVPPIQPEPAAPVRPEAGPVEKTATGIKNAAVDAERQSRGQEPILAPTRVRNQEVWESTMAKIESDPMWQDRLIGELQEKPRTPTPEEILALDHRYVDLQNEYTKAVAEGSKSFQEGNPLLVEEARLRANFYESKLNELEQVSKKIGTEWGRSGQMRQRLMKEDYSLAAMEARMRAAKGFEPLTEAEHAQIKTLHEKLAVAEAKAMEVEGKANQRIALVEAQKAMAEAKAQAGQMGYEPRILEVAERFAGFMDRQGAAAAKRLKERLGRVSAGLDPTILADVGIIGAAKITRGVVDFAKWTDAMAADVGEWIREHAQVAWDASQKKFEESLTGFNKNADKPTADKVRKASSELARLMREKQELQERLANEDYSPRHKKAVREIDRATAAARAEVMLLREQFARQLEKENFKRKSVAEKAWLETREGLNLSRALITSGDVSAVGRQGGFLVLGDPVLLAKAFVPMMRAIRSEKNAAAIHAQIMSRPNAVSGLYEKAGLFLAEREGSLTAMEELYMSKLARKIPGIAASNRAYVTFLNKLRADAFDEMHADLARGGTAELADSKAIANAINVFTGRGNIGKAAGAAESLSVAFFAPRLVASRFQILAGEPLYRGSARAKYVIAKRYARFLVGLGTVYGLAKLAGADVEDDSRSADFGKLKFGNTRVDPLAGLSQTTVFLTRLLTGEGKSGNKIYKAASSQTLINFLRNKLAPVPGGALDTRDILLGQRPPPGHPQTLEDVAWNQVRPMSLGDLIVVMEEEGIPKGTIFMLLSMLGWGVQNYDSEAKRK